jgi:hypothetical protein
MRSMTGLLALGLLAGSALALGGCVAGMAVGAAGMAAQGVMGHPQGNEQLQPDAANACSAAASKYGAVHVIDVEQHTASLIIVWGTVDDGKTRRSFECAFGTRVTALKLSAINPAH